MTALLVLTLCAGPVVPDVGIDQRVGAQVPLDLVFRDEDARIVRLGDTFAGKPALLVLAYYECPMLCTLVLNGVLRSLKVVTLDAGADFHVVVVSIDPSETPALARLKKETHLAQYGRTSAEHGWHFLTGEQASIAALASAVGFRYREDPAAGGFAHAAGIAVLTPEGRVARYFFGIEYAPKDVRLALVEASRGAIGTAVDALLLLCFHYDPATGRYTLAALDALRLAGGATALALAAFVLVQLRRERRRGVA